VIIDPKKVVEKLVVLELIVVYPAELIRVGVGVVIRLVCVFRLVCTGVLITNFEIKSAYTVDLCSTKCGVLIAQPLT
jgi:hypothetical protein